MPGLAHSHCSTPSLRDRLGDEPLYRQSMACSLLCVVWLLCCLLTGCSEEDKKEILSERALENLLYDYHQAHALAEQHTDSAEYYQRAYLAAVLAKHHITAEQLDHNMEWYMQRTEVLTKVYKRLGERLGDGTELLLNDAVGTDENQEASGDTLQLWQAEPVQILSAGDHQAREITLTLDSTLHEGDRLLWQLRTQWVYPEGNKTLIALLVLRYGKGDSIATTVRTFYTTDLQTLSFTVDRDDCHEATLLLYQQTAAGEKPKLLVISHEALLRIRLRGTGGEIHPAGDDREPLMPSSQTVKEAGLPRDSQPSSPKENTRRLQDSLLRTDAVHGRRQKLVN